MAAQSQSLQTGIRAHPIEPPMFGTFWFSSSIRLQGLP